MSSMMSRKMLTVAGMEFRLTAANKAFVIITIIGPFLIVAMSVLPSLLATGGVGGSEPVTVGLLAPPELAGQVRSAFRGSPVEVAAEQMTQAQMTAAVESEQLAGYIQVPRDVFDSNSIGFVTKSTANFQLIGTIEAIVGQAVVTARLSQAGLDPAAVQSLTRQPSLDVKRLDPEGGQESQDLTSVLFTTLAFTMMLYMTILLYGQAIGRSVLTEKTSKTVEIMLSSLSPRELLVGKILGKAAASLLQYAIWIGMAMLFLQVIGPLVNMEVSITGGGATYIYLLGFFLLAFFLYSAVYAALGAASEDEQHLGQLAWPVIFFLVVPMVLIGGIATNPEGMLPKILSIFPLTAPIVMFQRLLIGSPAVWEVALSVGLLLATIVALALVAAKIFRIGILMTGKRFSLGEVIRWVGYKE